MFSLRRYGRRREGVRIPSLKPRWTLQVAPCNKISKRSIPFCQERVLLEVSPANVGKPLQHGMIQWIMHWGISLTIVKMHDATDSRCFSSGRQRRYHEVPRRPSSASRSMRSCYHGGVDIPWCCQLENGKQFGALESWHWNMASELCLAVNSSYNQV